MINKCTNSLEHQKAHTFDRFALVIVPNCLFACSDLKVETTKSISLNFDNVINLSISQSIFYQWYIPLVKNRCKLKPITTDEYR